MILNSDYTLKYRSALGMVEKLIKQAIESGNLKNRFEVFDKDAVEYGKGFEIDVILSASKYSPSGGERAAEHGNYPASAFALTFDTVVGGQYPVTIENEDLREVVANNAKAADVAARKTESLYQGWIADKNAAVAAVCANLIGKKNLSGTAVTLGETAEGVDAWALDMLTAIKTWVENIREGVTGTSYGNSAVGAKYIAASDVVVVLSNETAALLDAHGLAKVFTPQYVETTGVTFVRSNRIADNTVLVTDSRNVQVRRKFDFMTEPIQNSDGSYNLFYNKKEYITAAINSASGAHSGQVAFPFIVISTIEAGAGA